jgi:hypothetical protein
MAAAMLLLLLLLPLPQPCSSSVLPSCCHALLQLAAAVLASSM